MKALLAAIRIAFVAIARSKLRAGLTVLGILIGVAAVVIVVALGTGVRQSVLGSISSLGANVIYVWPEATESSGARKDSQGRLTEADGQAILREASSVVAVAPFSSTQGQVLSSDRNVSTSIGGITLPYLGVRQFSVDRGAMWTESDELLKSKVCIIGETVREALFSPDEDPVGQHVRIGRYPYRVIGLLKQKGQSPFGEDQDDRLLMPLSSFQARVLPGPPGRVQMLLVSASDTNTVDRARRQVTEILRQRHQILPGDQPDFSVRTQDEFRKSQEAIFDQLTTLLLAIAAVSLFVGGIGVMNIMLVSVTERTREIGIRMAIGASAGDILTQFLVEAITLSVLGGVAGIALGSIVIRVLGPALGWDMTLPLPAVLAAVGTSAIIGVVFGYLPAHRAARMDPIGALRHE